MGSKERLHVGGDPYGPVGLALCRGHVGGELATGEAHPGLQVRRDGVQQCAGQPGRASVHPLQPIESHVGRSQLRRLHAVAYSLQGGQDSVEHLPVVGFVGVQHRGDASAPV